MSQLYKKKINFSRNNRYNPVNLTLEDIEISCVRNNISGVVTIYINSNGNEGEDEYRLDLSKREIDKLKWLFEERMTKNDI